MRKRHWSSESHYIGKLKLFYNAYYGCFIKVNKLNKLRRKRKSLAYRIKNRIEAGEYVNRLGVKSSRPPF